MENEIIKLIDNALANLALPQVDIVLEHPANEQFGDYSTNVALLLYPLLREEGINTYSSPHALADTIATQLNSQLTVSTPIAKIVVAGPGFINFSIKTSYYLDYLNTIITAGNMYGQRTTNKPKNIYIEHTQPNTNKPNHIGHLRNSVLGMALVNLLRTQGHHVVSTNINNDRGIANVKGMWAYLLFGPKIDASSLKSTDLITDLPTQTWQSAIKLWQKHPNQWPLPQDFQLKPDVWVGKFYIFGNHFYELYDTVKTSMLQMVQAWEDHDPQVRALWKLMNDWFYAGSWETLKKLNVELDLQEYESDLYQPGKAIIQKAYDSHLQYFNKLNNGAIQVELEAFGLPNKILIRGDGTAIYMTFDIELTRKRTQEYGMDLGVWVVGSDQDLHFKQLFQICDLLGFGHKSQWHHFSYGMVDLPSGKMSSRKGLVITADEVINLAIKKAQTAAIQAKISKLKKPKSQLIDSIALAAIKYGMLMVSAQSKIVFDVDQQVSFNGNSGPYLQYTHARCRSVLDKSPIDVSNTDLSHLSSIICNPEELALLRWFYRYPEVIESAAAKLSPHLVCTYLYELAQRYNTFYNQHSILGSSSYPVIRLTCQFRLLLTAVTAQILANGLSVLGINAPDHM